MSLANRRSALLLGVSCTFGCASSQNAPVSGTQPSDASPGSTPVTESGSGTPSTDSGTSSNTPGAKDSSTSSGTDGGASGADAGSGPTGDNLVDQYVCTYPAGGVPKATVVPSVAQVAYQHVELTAFLHFGLDTWDGQEQGNPSDPPSLFNPTNLTQDTANGWATTLKGVGFGQAMLVAKHSTGYCLWPSKATTYSVAGSPWMNGQGDVVTLFANAMKANGMRAAFYLAPWDQHAPSSATGYQTVLEMQMKELLTHYGAVYELWFDGANAPTAPIVHWGNVFQAVKMEQPFIDIWAGPEVGRASAADTPPAFPDLQWIGNENGSASRTTSSLDLSNCGGGTNRWCAWEATTTDSNNGDWFWHPGHQPKSLAQMQQIYFNTIGRNTTLIYNVPPDQTGAFDSKDVAVLQQFGTWYKSTFQTDLLKGAPAAADSTWANAGFEANKAVDDTLCTYWAAASGKTAGTLEVTPASPINIKVISIREPIELGERVTKYHVEVQQNGSWITPTDANGDNVQGTVIGNRQLWQVNLMGLSGIRLVIQSARDVPAIAEFAAY